MTNHTLSDSELQTLDGHCEAGTQILVDEMKARTEIQGRHPSLTQRQAEHVEATIHIAKKNGYFSADYTYGASCPTCGVGEEKLLFLGLKGVQSYSSLMIEGSPGERAKKVTWRAFVCTQCFEQTLPAIRAELVGVQAAFPEDFRIEGSQAFGWEPRLECTRCSWSGHTAAELSEDPNDQCCPQCEAGPANESDLGLRQLPGFDIRPLLRI